MGEERVQPDRGMIHVLGRTRQDGESFHHASQNGDQFKMYELFISGIFHLLYLDFGRSRIPGTLDREPQMGGGHDCVFVAGEQSSQCFVCR